MQIVVIGLVEVDARDGVETEEGLAGEVVEAEHVVVEHREPDHGRMVLAFLGAGRELERLVKHRVQSGLFK